MADQGVRPFVRRVIADPCRDRAAAFEIRTRSHHQERLRFGKRLAFGVAREGD